MRPWPYLISSCSIKEINILFHSCILHLSDYQAEDLYTLSNELDGKFDMVLNKYSPNPMDTNKLYGWFKSALMHAPLSAFQGQPPPIFKIVMCGDFAC